MSIQYNETDFSENIPADEAVEEFQQRINDGLPVMALHVGSKYDLDKRKEKAKLEKRLSDLEDRLDTLEKPESEWVKIPTDDQVDQFGGRSYE